MSVIESTLLTFFSHHPGQSILIAYSGGVDSQVLLHSLSVLSTQNKLQNKITVFHVNHGLSPNAVDWELFAKEQCKDRNIELIISRVGVKQKAQHSLEALARDARYDAIKKVVTDNTLVVTGHHNDDQAETFLLALKRGSGLKGLSAMKSLMPLGKASLVRPLLNIPRAEIEKYAQENGLEWIEDESNQDKRFDRNFIRHDVMPLLTKRWPSFLSTVNRSAEHCQEGAQLLAELAKQDLQQCSDSNSKLSVKQLKLFSQIRFNNVIRYFLTQHECLMPSKPQLEQLFNQLTAGEDKTPEVKVGEHWLRRNKGYLYLTPEFEDVSSFTCLVSDIDNEYTIIELPDNLGSVKFVSLSPSLLDINHINTSNSEHIDKITVVAPKLDQQVTVSFRHSNPSCLPAYRQKSRPLKKVLQELAIPPWQRKRIPFVYYDNELVAALGYFVCKPYIPS
jgi:tRNA(Ile)-lysidine synthase